MSRFLHRPRPGEPGRLAEVSLTGHLSSNPAERAALNYVSERPDNL